MFDVGSGVFLVLLGTDYCVWPCNDVDCDIVLVLMRTGVLYLYSRKKLLCFILVKLV